MSEFNYFKEKQRMAKNTGALLNGYYCDGLCRTCPLAGYNNRYAVGCTILEMNYPEEAEAIVRKWSEEHPAPQRKTRKEVLLEKFPKAKMDEKGVPYACTLTLGITSGCQFREKNGEDCGACWNTEAEE